MAQMKCPDCNALFDGALDSCPVCGCPTSVCSEVATVVNEPRVTTSIGNADNGKPSSYYYVDVSWFEKFTSDPWLLKFCMSIGWLRWLCASWHIGGKDEDLDTNHVIANDIFFILNRLFKLLIYPEVWAGFKLLWLLIVYVVVTIIAAYNPSFGGILLLVAMPIVYVFYFWMLLIGFGKSCSRYFIPMIGAIRHCTIVFVNNIKNNI